MRVEERECPGDYLEPVYAKEMNHEADSVVFPVFDAGSNVLFLGDIRRHAG
jgi:hypothetical protein